jgi:hypothetical protein
VAGCDPSGLLDQTQPSAQTTAGQTTPEQTTPAPTGPAASPNSLTVHNYSAHQGCVTIFVRYIDNSSGEDWLELKGQMAGCRRGNLHLHTYINTPLGTLFANGNSNECQNSTACETVWTERIYIWVPGIYDNEAHGWNTTTGGSDYAVYEFLYF